MVNDLLDLSRLKDQKERLFFILVVNQVFSRGREGVRAFKVEARPWTLPGVESVFRKKNQLFFLDTFLSGIIYHFFIGYS